MQNNFYSLMYDAGSDAGRLTDHAGSGPLDHLQSLQYANDRLLEIVAELLLKNEALRSKLAHYGSPEMLQTSFEQAGFRKEHP
jgi:hypothetical protein